MSRFSKEAIKIIKNIPAGKVVSYGQAAAYVGVPRGARQVGWILRQAQDKFLPWWQVINNAGRISIKANMFHDAGEQGRLLMAEGVEVREDFSLDIEKYRFRPSENELKRWGLDGEYLKMVWERFRTGF